MDSIVIRGVALEASIGVYPWERDVKQRLVFDITLGTDTRKAAATDDLAFAVDYEQVVLKLKQVVAAQHYNLLEALAEAVANALLALANVSGVTVATSKPNAVAAAANTQVVIQRP